MSKQLPTWQGLKGGGGYFFLMIRLLRPFVVKFDAIALTFTMSHQGCF